MSKSLDAQFRIGEAARVAGVSVSTLRLWESHGLVEPERLPGGHRVYTPSQIAQLQEIVRLRQQNGLNAAAIRGVMASHSKPEPKTRADHIGHRIRLLRHAAGKTLGQVAAELNVAASALSTFERTSSGISFKTLSDLAHYYGSSVSALSGDEQDGQRTLVRAGEWRSWPQTSPGVTVQLMAEGPNQMDCHRFVLQPGASSEGSYRHDGEEFLHVLSGRLEVILDQSEVYDLRPGDTLYFASSRQHSWANRDAGVTILIWINTPPTF